MLPVELGAVTLQTTGLAMLDVYVSSNIQKASI